MKGAVPRNRKQVTTQEPEEELPPLPTREKPQEPSAALEERGNIEESPPTRVDEPPRASEESPIPTEVPEPPREESIPSRPQRSRHPPQRYGEFYCHTLGPQGQEKLISRGSVAQIASRDTLSNTTYPASGSGPRSKEKVCQAEKNEEVKTAWAKIQPKEFPLSEEE